MSDGHAITAQIDPAEPAIESVYNGKLAMWLFLCSEVMFFAGLLGAYITLRIGNPGIFDADQKHLHDKVPVAAFNTALLISSSLTMALAVLNGQLKNRAKQRGFLLATALMGSLFIGLKIYEYTNKFGSFSPRQEHVRHMLEEEAHGAPVDAAKYEAAEKQLVFSLTAPEGIWPKTSIFFGFYCTLTGIHAVHILAGVIPILGLWWFAKDKDVSHETEMVGLYWHFVDLVWIFLFPLMYLI